MARTTSVTLGSQQEIFLANMVASGRYGSASEVVRSALRLLESEESYLQSLRQEITAGEASGKSELSLADIAAQVRAKHHV